MAGEVNNNGSRVSTALTIVKDNAGPAFAIAAKQVGPAVRGADNLIDKIAPFNPPAVVSASDRRTHALAGAAYVAGMVTSWIPFVNVAADGAIAALGYTNRNSTDAHRQSAANLAQQTGYTTAASSVVLGWFAFSAPQNTALYARAAWKSFKTAFATQSA